MFDINRKSHIELDEIYFWTAISLLPEIYGTQFKTKLEKTKNPAWFYVDAANKNYEFWERDSLAVHLFLKKVSIQI